LPIFCLLSDFGSIEKAENDDFERSAVAERTNFPREVAEAALAHVVGDKVEAAYRRGDLIEKRRRLMNAWATYCATGSSTAGVVVSLKPVKA
jgi:hypothetical protein